MPAVGCIKPTMSSPHSCTQSPAYCMIEPSLRIERTLDTARIITPSKLRNPTSCRRWMLHHSCIVRDKNSGPRPFLYLVQKDEAYIGGYTIAASEYRNVCSITALPGK